MVSLTSFFSTGSFFQLWQLASFSFVALLALGSLIYLIGKKAAFVPLALVCFFWTAELLEHFLSITRTIYQFRSEHVLYTFGCRISWALYILAPLALMLLYGYLLKNRYLLKIMSALNFLISFPLWFGFLYLAFGYYGVPSSSPETLSIELGLIRFSDYYLLFFYTQFLLALVENPQTETPLTWARPVIRAILGVQLLNIIDSLITITIGLYIYGGYSLGIGFMSLIPSLIAIGCSIAIYTKTKAQEPKTAPYW